ncbi:ACT domain-containing protein [Fusobacterium necrophorum]|uniref:ACT domain-containing protein n=1 Tax=Fusobacterium necrophorum TaxID=859 RepID=UPI0010110993|nr:ACT domain-containing protein [Fusobacterium necrophorum]RXZ28216.1 ACT domain-containing protein [Fusobacterium necrophorum]
MKCIITVLGTDKVGIIAKVCTYLSEVNINILDISQTIIGGYFNMMMIVDITETTKKMEEVNEELLKIGKKMGVIITTQHEDIFNCMHRV